MAEMTTYNTQYKCYSVSMMAGNERADVEKGGKSKKTICILSSCFVFLYRFFVSTFKHFLPTTSVLLVWQ